MNHKIVVTVLLVLATAACNANSPSAEAGLEPVQEVAEAPLSPTPASVPATGQSNKDGQMNELAPFIQEGTKLLDSVVGDLDADGRPDAVLILDPPAGADQKLGEGLPRTVVLLLRDADGQLHEARRNDNIVPCSTCGGMAGDPYGYVRIESGAFIVAVGGGSRESWSNNYTFRYAAAQQDWLLEKVQRKVIDREVGTEKQQEWTQKDFGVVPFKDFSPSILPEVELE